MTAETLTAAFTGTDRFRTCRCCVVLDDEPDWAQVMDRSGA